MRICWNEDQYSRIIRNIRKYTKNIQKTVGKTDIHVLRMEDNRLECSRGENSIEEKKKLR